MINATLGWQLKIMILIQNQDFHILQIIVLLKSILRRSKENMMMKKILDQEKMMMDKLIMIIFGQVMISQHTYKRIFKASFLIRKIFSKK